ncbi:ESPR-type extended signal peptide-containing protein, partial [Histophilus somni]|uniref:ESPR-type extended signal peptide-containing protein n=1 Tax=Histophilus somni TaxID=731 RepID=UPI0010AA2859
MNKIFKTKYDITTGQCKAVSELASNRQIASSSKSKPKCGGFLGMFKVLPLALLMSGMLGVSSVSYADIVYIDMDGETGAAGVKKDWSEAQYWKNKDRENILIAPVQNKNNSLNRYGGTINTDLQKSVIIGPMSVGRKKAGDNSTGIGMTVLGHGAVGYSSQTTAIGNNVYTGGEQATAIGSDVMAAGYASIAIGNDDIYSHGGYADKLPIKTIKQVYGYTRDRNYKGNTKGITYKDLLDESEFNKKYGVTNGSDSRHYSPTYAAGVGAIAIGSRSVAFGDASLAIGTLSFALGKDSTAVGIRAFVNADAEGGVAIGDESRVFATNSFAIGNEAEATNKGSLTFGSGSKAVGFGSIAIGENVSSNAALAHNGDDVFKQSIATHTQVSLPTEKVSFDEPLFDFNNRGNEYGDKNPIVKLGFRALNPDNQKNPVSKIIEQVINDKKNIKFAYEHDEVIETTKKIYKTTKEGDHAISLGYHLSNNGDNTIAIGSASVVRGANSVVLGALNNVGKYARNTIALGIGTNVYKENSVAIGTGVNVFGAGAIAIGSGVGVTKDNTISIGYGSHGLSRESIVLGNDASLKVHAQKSIVIGNNARIENKSQNLTQKIENEKNRKFGSERDKVELEMSAISIGTKSHVYSEKGIALGDNAKIEADSENAIAFGATSKATKKSAMALGNETEATMENSVALGYKSHTKYFYANDNSKNTATLSGQDAINLAPYIPEGSSYNLTTDKTAGIVSVGWNKSDRELGLRRIVGVAPGALDSDVATIGQLKALEYVKREGLVVYYTQEGNQLYKLVKSAEDGNFYKADTKYGTPIKELGSVSQDKVLVGAKGALEKEFQLNRRKFVDIGQKIRFGHLKDGEIKSDSDQAITGNQLKNVGDILGVSVNTPNNTQFDSYKFTAVDYEGSQKKQKTIFKDAIEELITAVNKGIVIQDADSHTGTLNLGSTLTIKAGNIDKPKSDVDGFSSDNIKTSYQPTRKELLIGIKDKPIFKEVTISGTVNDRSDKKTLTTKEYVDGKLANVATSFTVNGNTGNYIVQNALNIKGKADASRHKNITTEAKTNEKELEISLNKDLKDIASITGEGIKSGKNTVYSKIAFNSTNGSNATTNVTISSNGANYTFDRTGFDMSDRRITRLQSGLNTQHHGPKGANGNPENVSKILDGSYITTIKGNAVNVSDLSNVAKAIVEKGLKFAGNSGSEITRKLGEKLTIKGNGTDLTSKTDSKKGEITFTLHKATSIDDNTATNSNKDKVVTAGAVKTYLDSKIDGISTTLGLEADNSKNSGPTGKVNLKNEKLKVAGTSDEIETKVEQDKQSITLSFAQNTKNKLGMITVDGDKLALGKNAKTVDKMTAPKEAKVTVGSDNLKFNWTGGVSADDKEQSKKSVISVGDTGKEHLITHVAAGKVEVNSTDAINGSQLYGVVDAFSKLAINVLGAEADLTSGFKKSSFDVVKYNGNTNTQTSKEMTFKDAIGQNTTAINKGFIFGVGDSNNEQGTHYLGDKLIIKAGAVDKPTSTSDDGYSPDNIKTAYLAKSKELLIGIKDKPTFKEVKVSGTVDDSSDGKTLTTKTYVDGKLANVAANFDVKGDNNNVVYTLNKQNNVLNINGDTKNIETKVDKDNKKVSITLKEALTGITSIGKDTNNQIAFLDSGTTLKAGGSSLNLTDSGGKVKISNVANGTSDNDAINKLQLNFVVSALGGEAKIGADGNVTAPSYTLANGNKAPYTTVGEALSALDEVLTSVNGAGITFSDGTTNNDFVRKNSENDKKVVIKSGSNINVSLSKTNSDKTGEFTVALNKDLEDINSITLKDNNNSSGHSATNKTGKITVDGATGDVKVQHGDGGASKIVIESGLKALTGNDEIQVTGGGKVFGNASLSLKDASIAGTKLKDNTIAEAKLDQGIKDKLNKTFMVKAGGTTSDNLIGNTLEFAAKDSNLTVELDKSNKKISYGLSSTLTGVESIAKDKTKISLA